MIGFLPLFLFGRHQVFNCYEYHKLKWAVHCRLLPVGDSNSNWTFIALNLPKQEDSKAQQNKSSQQNSVSRDITGVEHHGERQEDDSG